MSEFSPTIATHEVRLNRLDRDIDKLSEICSGLVKTQSEICTTIRLLQDSQSQHALTQVKMQGDVDSLKQSAWMVSGGWKAVCIIGGIVTILSKLMSFGMDKIINVIK